MLNTGLLLLTIASVLFGIVCLALSSRRRVRQDAKPSSSGAKDDYQLISEASGDVAFEYDSKARRIQWSSDIGHRFLDYDEGEMSLTLLPEDEHVHLSDRARVAEAFSELAKNKASGVVFRLLRKDGESCWVSMSLIPVDSPTGEEKRVVGVLRDTTELHVAQEALGEARRMQTVGTMAGGIAHEFNNHLTPVRGYIELALDHLGEEHAVSQGLRTALDRVEYCSDLVGQIQAYGRKSLLVPKPIELTRILPSIVRVAMSTDRKRAAKVSVEEHIPTHLAKLWVDQGQFQQAIVHLIRNSLAAMPGGGALTVRAEQIAVNSVQALRRGARAGDFMRISIIDTGVGISPQHLEHIFEPFFTTHGRASAQGMGLPMVQGMVAQHGGWVEIHSEPMKGTRVMIYLPLLRQGVPEEEEISVDADGTMAVMPAAALGHLLVVDDEEFIRDIVRRVFETEGWSVKEARDKNDALKHLEDDKTKYDLVILDITTPGPTTEETLQRLHETNSGTRVLLISGFTKDDRIEKITQENGIEFMGKPFSPKEILTKVDQLMAVQP